MQRKKIELFIIGLYSVAVAVLIYFLHMPYLISTLVFFVPPIAYLVTRRPLHLRAAATFALLISIPLTTIVDYMATVSNSWFESTMFSSRVLGVFPFETLLWGFLYVTFIILFYKYFLDRDTAKMHLNSRVKYFFIALWIMLSIFGVFHFTSPNSLIFDYFYVKFVVVAFIIPLIIAIITTPQIMKKVILQGVYFAVISFFAEIASLSAQNWGFAGKYIGTFSVLGFQIPVEEFLWMVLAVPVILCAYEHFADDRK